MLNVFYMIASIDDLDDFGLVKLDVHNMLQISDVIYIRQVMIEFLNINMI